MNDDTDTTSQRVRRYLIVTATAAPVNLLLYVALLTLVDIPALLANVATASVIAPATFFAYRSWVWQVGEAPTFRRDVAPYWVATITNVCIASVAIIAVGRVTDATVALALTPPAAYAFVTALRYFQLDRWIFRPSPS